MNWFSSFWKALNTPMESPSPRIDEAMGSFTPRAQQVLALARKEADRFHHNFVGTEHVLLGLISLGRGTAVNVLQRMGLDLQKVRQEVEKQVGTGPDVKLVGNVPYTPRVKKMLALAVKEARALNHTYVGTEHLLLGLLREGDGVAARVLKNLEVDVESVRIEILKELDPNFSARLETAAPAAAAAQQPSSAVDTSKRYDIYCRDRNEDVVVYRNALFKGRKNLFLAKPFERFPEFLEIEQEDGQTIFVATFSIYKFCEHRATPGAESVS